MLIEICHSTVTPQKNDEKTIFQVDSFTDKPFKGNPAGVMIVTEDISSDSIISKKKKLTKELELLKKKLPLQEFTIERLCKQQH